MFLGTHLENIEDAKRKGRWRNKLTDDDIPVIRYMLAVGCRQHDIGMLFGIDPSVISEINTGKVWKHV